MKTDTTYDGPLAAALEQLGPDDHYALIYESPEDHFAVAIPFIRIGLDRGEKCIYIADDEAAVRDAMYSQGINVKKAMATGSLVLETKDSVYLRQGSFDPEWTPAFWRGVAAETLRQGFPALRITGETAWLVGGARGVEGWIEYESRLTNLLASLNCLALCQYNLHLLPPELILGVIRTHPMVIYRGVICPNMYYVPPDEFLATNQNAREAERLLATICERAEIEQTLRQQRNELRKLANRLMHAQDDERRRIANVLHETTAQDLAALKMLLARLSRTAGHLSDGERGDLAESISLAEQSMAGIRTVSYLLHPPFLDDAGLLSALKWYACGFSERSGIRLELDLAENFERLPGDTETVLFRIVQESLTNIHRHAGSETAFIRLQRDAGMLVLEIEDLGRGIPNAALEHITSAGGGIAGMSERLDPLGGRLEVTSTGHGTMVRVWLPLVTERG